MFHSFRTTVAEARRYADLYFTALLSQDRILNAFGAARATWQVWVYRVAKREIRYFQHGKHRRIMFKPEWVEDFVSRNTHAPIDGALPVSFSRKIKTIRAMMPETSKHGFHWNLSA
jgi:hypothetical protein